jgi:hypothetical protein
MDEAARRTRAWIDETPPGRDYAGGALLSRDTAGRSPRGDCETVRHPVRDQIHRVRPGTEPHDGKLQLADRSSVTTGRGRPAGEQPRTGWLEISLLHLATMTAGFDKEGGYTLLLFRPGSKWG